MCANTLTRKVVEMPRYQFVVGVSTAALEEELNRLVIDEPCLKLIQVVYAMGTGFVAVVEHTEITEDEKTEVKKTEKVERPKESRPPKRRSPKKP